MLCVAHNATGPSFLGAPYLVVDRVAGRTRLADALAHRIAFKPGVVAVRAICASLPPPRDVNEMKLLHQIVVQR